MATLVAPKPQRLSFAATLSLRISVWQAVLLSRVLVLAAGSAGALFMRPVPGWQAFDKFGVTTGLGSVGNVLGASVVRWDSVAYLSVARHGYASPSSTVRFPLYPILIGTLAPIVHSGVIAGVLISLTAFTVALILIHRLASEHLGSRVADTTVLLLAFAPWSFVFSADYTTSLQLLCVAATFYLAQRGRFLFACMAAAAGAVTHVEGVLLVAPLVVIYWKQHGRSFEPRRLWSPELLAFLLPPLALAGFTIYLHARGYGWLAPVTHQNLAVVGRRLVGPPMTLFLAIKDIVVGIRDQLVGDAPPTGGLPLGTQNCIYLTVLMIAVLAAVNTWRRLPREYAIYGVLAILLCTSSAVTLEPLKAFDRYMLPIFPLWIGAAAWISERRVTTAVMTLSSGMLIVYTIQFTRWISVF